MHLLNISVILCSVTSSVFTKPYQYSYYVSLPGHFQSLEFKDGAVVVNNVPPVALSPVPGFRQGRVDPVFNPNPGINRQFPVASGNPGNPSFNPGVLTPGFNQNPGFDGRYPIIPRSPTGPDFRQGGLNPSFNQYPAFGRRNPNQNEPDYSRGRDPDNEEIPDGDLDTQFDPNRQFLNRPGFGNGRVNPGVIPNSELDPQFNRGVPYSPAFGNRIQPLIPGNGGGISRMTLNPQEIDERNNSNDREEVTTQRPCIFCGVNKINPMDEIDGTNVNPDSEPVEPKNVSGATDPGFVIQNNLGTPVSGGVPGYLFNSPSVTYYALASL